MDVRLQGWKQALKKKILAVATDRLYPTNFKSDLLFGANGGTHFFLKHWTVDVTQL